MSDPAAPFNRTESWIGPRRFVEQKWLTDLMAKTSGIDNRASTYAAVCGPESNADYAAIRARVNKHADITPAFEAAARRRETKAAAAEEAGQNVTARNNYFIAAVHWAAAQWLIEENSEQNLHNNQRKRECYTRYGRLADHKVEPVWIPFRGKALPGWFHLPPGYQGGRIPAVVSFQGMDGFKEMGVSLHGDRWLQRGIAVLAVEGPGQYECPVLGIYVTMDAWVEVGPVLMEWMRARPEVDPEKVGLFGSSFGSFFGTLCAAHEPRFRAVTVRATCLEPGCHSIFQEAPPTYKRRFMYMANYTDEDAFDEFCKTLTWEGHSERIRMPYLCVAGESDALSPLVHTERMFGTLQGPKQLVIYQDAAHGISGVPAANLGPEPSGYVADWMQARFEGKPFASERWFVEAGGRIVTTPY